MKLTLLRLAVACLGLLSVPTAYASSPGNYTRQSQPVNQHVSQSTEWLPSKPGITSPVRKSPVVPIPTRPKRTPMNADAKMCTISANLTANPEEGIYVGSYIFALDVNDVNNYYNVYMMDGEMLWPMEVPAGTYDFIMFFDGISGDPDNAGIYVVCRRNVTVNDDYELTASYDEVTDYIEFKPILADGETILTERWEETSPEKWELVESGNVRTADYSTMFIFKGLPFMRYDANYVDYGFIGDKLISTRYNSGVRFKPDSDLSFYQTMAVTQQEEGVSLIAIGCDPSKSQTASNNPKDYTSPVECNFGTSLLGDLPFDPSSYEPNPNDCGYFGFYTFLNGNLIVASNSGMTGTGSKFRDNVYHFCPDPTYAPGVKMMPVYEHIIAGLDDGYGIVSPIYDFESNQWNVFHQSSVFSVNSFVDDTSKSDNGKTKFKPNPWFSCQNSGVMEFGSSAPFVSFIRPLQQFGYSFVGRYGELRTIDLLNHEFSFKIGDNEVCNKFEDLNNYFWYTDEFPEGDWRISIVDENLKVDDIQIRTSCDMYFPANVPPSSPTLMQLQVCNNDGVITDRLESADDGVVTFAAGDFVYTEGENWTYWYTYEQLKDVKVEYAPCGSSDFTLLEAVEDPDKFFMPGYGAFYTVDLKQITRGSDNKWYDLRFTLADADGNSQTQTISPCLRIENVDASGVDSLFDNLDGTAADVWNVNGTLVAKGLDRKSIGTLPAGIYIIKSEGKTMKHIVK